MITHDLHKRRITALMLFFGIFAGAVVLRAGAIQLLNNPRLEQLARRQFQSKFLVRPRRGPILDRNGEALAINVEIHSLAANPSKIKNKKTLARLLTRATNIPLQKITQKLSEKREFIWIKRHVSEAEMNQFKKIGLIDHDGDLVDGLWLVKESQRVYPHGEIAGHILGDVNLDSEGLEGAELWQNEKLRGKVISVSAIKDGFGRPTFIDAVAAKDVQDGEPVVLSIDASLQFAAERELKAAVEKSNARGGSVIVMNAVTGEVLAMANQPSFNPNEKSGLIEHRRNRALTDGYEPGSTLKAVLIAAALSKGWKLTDTVWGGRGEMIVQGKKISEAEAHEKFEWISLKKLIQVSSNVAAARVALKLGSDYYSGFLRNMGFGARTGTGFPGEIGGRLPAKKEWQPLTLANVGFGQGVLVTPMQMTRAFASIVNGGFLVEPTLLKPQGAEGADAREKSKRVLAPKVAEQVVEALESVTAEGGTGLKAKLEGYRVAGKTGTAQAVDPVTRRYSRSRYVASFIGFPVGIDAKLVIFTSVDEPRGVYYASETAAPLFREVLRAVVNRYSIPAVQPIERGKLLAGGPGAGGALLTGGANALQRKKVAVDADKITLSSAKAVPAADAAQVEWEGADAHGKNHWKMPSVKGLAPREALRALRNHKFELEIQGSGVVHHQSPEPGKSVADGETIRLILSEIQ